jgi:hypothetical protein
MNFIFLLIAGVSLIIPKHPEDSAALPCTCVFYENLKDQLKDEKLVAYAKVVRIDTVNIIESFLCKNEEALKYYYESNYTTLRIVFEKKTVLKGTVTTDTFSVISSNHCSFYFEKNKEYIVAASYQDFSSPKMVSDSLVENKQSLLRTNSCHANTEYYNGCLQTYMIAVK